MEKTPTRFLWHYIKIFHWYFLLLAICIIIRQISMGIEPYFLAKIFNTAAVDSGNWREIYTTAGIVAAISLFSMAIYEGYGFIRARYIPQLRTMVIRDTFEYVNRQSIAYFSKEMTGNISGKVNLLDKNALDAFEYAAECFHITSHLGVSLILLGWVSWHYAVLILVWSMVIAVISFYLGKIRRKLGKETGKLSSTANGMIVDALANYSEIKSFANFHFERYNLLKSLRLLRRAETREGIVMAYIRIVQQFLGISSFVGFVFFSIYMLQTQKIDSTQFIYVNTLFWGIAGTSFRFSWMYNQISRLIGNMSSALETLAVEPEITDMPNAKNLPKRKSGIRFENVFFGYNREKPLFSDLTVEIKAGEKVGLVGLSGAGKSTFVKLISRYYDIQGGSIKINGHDIRSLTQDSLHRNIATIPQDISLFNRSLFDNIRYGKTDADLKEVVAAAKKACADVFIKGFPEGYQTKVGDRGVILSGGERQRIAIARAILKNAPILIFDEATSALDSQSERLIQKSLHNLMKGKTVLAIAHRLSTLREMDRILVFDNGKIIESGSHNQLLKNKGVYYKLYNMQISGFM